MSEHETTQAEVYAAITLLRDRGWILVPPVDPAAETPEPQVGQVWRSPKARVEPRTVTKIAGSRAYPWTGDNCVFFTTPSGRNVHLHPETWRAWARKTGARPA